MGLKPVDVERLIGAKTVDQLCDDDMDGLRDEGILESVLTQADDFCASFLIKGWSREQIETLLEEDQSLRTQCGWVAAEMLSERRPEFLAEDGRGRYWAQYDRATKYLDRLAKAQAHSVGEAKAGASKQRGGAVSPVLPAAQPSFTFAPSKNNPYGSGGF